MAKAKILPATVGLSLLAATIYAIVHLYLLTQHTPLNAIAPTVIFQIASTFLLIFLVLGTILYLGLSYLYYRKKTTP
jgi:hypothetical protein